MSGSDEFTFLSGKRGIIDDKVHGNRRFRNFLERNRLRMFRGAERISTIDYNEYVGRIGVGKVDNGKIRVNQEVVLVNAHEPEKQRKVKEKLSVVSVSSTRRLTSVFSSRNSRSLKCLEVRLYTPGVFYPCTRLNWLPWRIPDRYKGNRHLKYHVLALLPTAHLYQ